MNHKEIKDTIRTVLDMDTKDLPPLLKCLMPQMKDLASAIKVRTPSTVVQRFCSNDCVKFRNSVGLSPDDRWMGHAVFDVAHDGLVDREGRIMVTYQRTLYSLPQALFEIA
jgi:hypothetical protein